MKARTDVWALSAALTLGQCLGRRMFELNKIGMGSEEREYGRGRGLGN